MADKKPGNIRKLKSGHYVLTSVVGAMVLKYAQDQVPIPDPPMVDGESNPHDPQYNVLLASIEAERETAAIAAMIDFGLELVDHKGNPIEVPKGKWIKKLKKMGVEFDAEDPDELETIFLQYIAVTTADIPLLMGLSGLSQEEISAADELFRSQKK